MTEATQAFFQQLQDQLWKSHAPAGPRAVGYNEVVRKLTDEEWDRVKAVIVEENILCQMGNADFGFNLAMYLFKCPLYPGPSPEWVLKVAAQHLPWWGQEKDSHWNRSWEEFKQFTHSDKNTKILKFFGMEAPQPKTHYEY